MDGFRTTIGTGALICYILAIVFDNSGFGALALGLTIYGLN